MQFETGFRLSLRDDIIGTIERFSFECRKTKVITLANLTARASSLMSQSAIEKIVEHRKMRASKS